MRRAFTLIETLIAIAVFSLGVLILFDGFTLSLRYSRASRDTAVATHAAEQAVEQIRLSGFTALAINTNPSPIAVSGLDQGQQKTFVDLYSGNANIKQVTVEIYYRTRPESQAISLTTLVSQNGIHG
ncbi:MAG TPA: type II secretion system protein [Candidatus Saccharimonadales bacterium]|nr:type II secretion system protein [Candidatus Saccharimonadales bacterium]